MDYQCDRWTTTTTTATTAETQRTEGTKERNAHCLLSQALPSKCNPRTNVHNSDNGNNGNNGDGDSIEVVYISNAPISIKNNNAVFHQPFIWWGRERGRERAREERITTITSTQGRQQPHSANFCTHCKDAEPVAKTLPQHHYAAN